MQTAPAKIRFHPIAALLIALLLLNGAVGSAEEKKVSLEHKVKAAFMVNFISFVTWPEKSFADKKSPWVIGIIGKDPFGSYLKELVKGKKIANRTITIEELKPAYTKVEKKGDKKELTKAFADSVKSCHLIFFGKTSGTEEKDTLGILQDEPILTIGEEKSFVRDGGMLRFFIEKKKVRFEINVDATKKVALKVSSKLLRLAKVARDPVKK